MTKLDSRAPSRNSTDSSSASSWRVRQSGPPRERQLVADPTASPLVHAAEVWFGELERTAQYEIDDDARKALLTLVRQVEIEAIRETIPLRRTGMPLAEIARRAVDELNGNASEDMRTHAALEGVESMIRWGALSRLRQRLALLEPKLAELDDETIRGCFTNAKPKGASRGRGNRGAADVLSGLLAAVGVRRSADAIRKAAARAEAPAPRKK